MKMIMFLGACPRRHRCRPLQLHGKKPAAQAAAKSEQPQPTVQDNTENNVADFKNQLEAERQKEQQNALAATAAGDPALRT